MSLILEALKKSEQQRHLGEAPNLGTPIVLTRPRRSALPALAAAIVIALVAGWWLLREPAPTAPAMSAVPAKPAAPAPAPVPAATKPVSRIGSPNRPVPATPVGNHAAPSKPVEVAQPVLPMPGLPDAPGSVTAPAMPMPSPVVIGGEGTPKDDGAAAAPGAAKNPAQVATRSTAKPASTVTTPAAATGALPVPAAPPAPAAARRATAKPVQPSLPSIWELPYATRKDLPEIDLTMHVWSPTPAERFVVVKGERHVEGEQIADGVVLQQITTDGLVLEFHGQRFTFPRDGR